MSRGIDISRKRRPPLDAVGLLGGTAAPYNVMATMGQAAGTRFDGTPDFSRAKPGTTLSVLDRISRDDHRVGSWCDAPLGETLEFDRIATVATCVRSHFGNRYQSRATSDDAVIHPRT